jgi:hypothetical protein
MLFIGADAPHAFFDDIVELALEFDFRLIGIDAADHDDRGIADVSAEQDLVGLRRPADKGFRGGDKESSQDGCQDSSRN